MSDLFSERGFRAALVQLCSGRNVDKNVDDAVALIREAAAGGAHYVQTPEVTTLMELETAKLFAAVEPEEGNRALQRFRDVAADLKIWLHIGSMPVKVAPDKIANRAYLLTPEGSIAATYDKIHMFDVDLPGGESYRESKNYRPGERARGGSAAVGWARTFDLLRLALPASLPGAREVRRQISFASQPRSRKSPGRLTGTRCCAPGPSNVSASSLRPRKEAGTSMAGTPTATA